MRELLVATKNPGKFREIGEALGGLKGAVNLHFLGDLQVDDGDFVEDSETFRENAEKKARYYGAKLKDVFLARGVAATDFFVLAEDSGIIVEALKGELGVKTRRWGAGEGASDEKWVEYFLKRMAGVPGGERGAEFVCEACLTGVDGGHGAGKERQFEEAIPAGPEGREFVRYFSGTTRGVITRGLEAPVKAGVPLSSCFRPAGFERVYSALSTGEKNRISHRGKAMAGVREFFADL